MLLSWALTAALVGAPDAEKGKEPLKAGQEAPSFYLPTMNAQLSKTDRFVLRNLVGDEAPEKKRAVVLSFAASYCAPCKKELKELPALKAKLDEANIVLAVVVIDTKKEGREMMRKLTVDELKLPFPVLNDKFGIVGKRYRAYALPTMVVISPEGKVRWVNTGFKEDTLTKLQGELGLLAKK